MFENGNASAVFKALGDETRLRIMRILMQGESYTELLASRLELTGATVSHHLKKLEEAGLVESHRTQFYVIYSVRRELLSSTLSSLIGSLPEEDGDEKYRQTVIDSFISGGRLRQIPSQQKKREIVFRWILGQLEDRAEYSEKELSAHIEKFHPDYCTIRRDMISLGILERTHDSGEEIYRKK